MYIHTVPLRVVLLGILECFEMCATTVAVCIVRHQHLYILRVKTETKTKEKAPRIAEGDTLISGVVFQQGCYLLPEEVPSYAYCRVPIDTLRVEHTAPAALLKFPFFLRRRVPAPGEQSVSVLYR